MGRRGQRPCLRVSSESGSQTAGQRDGRRQCGVGAQHKSQEGGQDSLIGRLGPTRRESRKSRGHDHQLRECCPAQVCFPTEGTLRVGLGAL